MPAGPSSCPARGRPRSAGAPTRSTPPSTAAAAPTPPARHPRRRPPRARSRNRRSPAYCGRWGRCPSSTDHPDAAARTRPTPPPRDTAPDSGRPRARAFAYAYRFDAADFRPLGDSAVVATRTVTPLGPPERVGDLFDLHERAGIELRVRDTLWPFWDDVLGRTLRFSGIRLHNARPAP
ncbi:DUF6886 family protein [Actinosynnema sp. NPDC050436]|uniref:DUF6886 family protein n=1 Tax=Actinosynnema sp. NPDC050436 TaxID=3155659 RepID=UPI00340EC5C9